jgi:hypothetical protein
MTNPISSDTATTVEDGGTVEQIDLDSPRPVDIDLTAAETIRLPESGVDDGGDVARKPDQIVAEIEATRAELADTIDAIASRINPRRAASKAKAQVAGAVSSATGTASLDTGAADSALPPGAGSPLNDPKILAVAGVVGAVIALLIFRRRH